MNEMKFYNYWNLILKDLMILLSVEQINEGLLWIELYKEKNRFKVALLIENPSQIHNTIVSPMEGELLIKD